MLIYITSGKIRDEAYELRESLRNESPIFKYF